MLKCKRKYYISFFGHRDRQTQSLRLFFIRQGAGSQTYCRDTFINLSTRLRYLTSISCKNIWSWHGLLTNRWSKGVEWFIGDIMLKKVNENKQVAVYMHVSNQRYHQYGVECYSTEKQANMITKVYTDINIQTKRTCIFI